MRPAIPLLAAALLVLGGAACGDSGDVGETLEEVGNTVSEAATDAADTIGDAAEDVGDTVGETADLVGFCDAARRTREAVDANNAGDALEAAEDLAAEAPEDVASEAEAVLDGVRAWHDGDQEAVQGEDFQQAAEDLRTYAEERCDPTS